MPLSTRTNEVLHELASEPWCILTEIGDGQEGLVGHPHFVELVVECLVNQMGTTFCTHDLVILLYTWLPDKPLVSPLMAFSTISDLTGPGHTKSTPTPSA